MDSKMLGSYLPIIVMVGIFYFMLYRPQKNAQKRRKSMLEELKTGHRVMTIGGIYGEITEIQENVVTLKIAENVEIQVARSSINTNVSENQSA